MNAVQNIEAGWFDGHNDILLKLSRHGFMDIDSGYTDPQSGHLNQHTATVGGFTGGFFAIFVPSRVDSAPSGTYKEIGFTSAIEETLRQIYLLNSLEQKGYVEICTSVAQLNKVLVNTMPSAILHLEGAEALQTDFPVLDLFYKLGVRSVGPVWSRKNSYGSGVPLKLSCHPDIGPGLTEKGKQLVRDCNRLGILIDLSHLNEKGFWDVASLSDAPLVATHSNAYELCPHARNLSDEQLKQIALSNGVVGLTFAEEYLRPYSNLNEPASIVDFINHFEHVIDVIGEDSVAIGSDFDGCQVVAELSSASAIPKLRSILRQRGHRDITLEKVFVTNWLRVVKATWTK